MKKIDLFELFIDQEKRKFDDNFAWNVVKVFDASDIKNLYLELCLYRDKRLVGELEMAVFSEICDDTHQGRMLGEVFPEMRDCMHDKAFCQKCKVVFMGDGTFVVTDEKGEQSHQLENSLSVDDVLYEIEVTYGKHAKYKVIEQIMSNPEFCEVEWGEAGSFVQLMGLNLKPIADVIGHEAVIEFYLSIP